MHSAPLNLGPEVAQIQAIGGVDNDYARGFFVINDEDHVYNVSTGKGAGKPRKFLCTLIHLRGSYQAGLETSTM